MLNNIYSADPHLTVTPANSLYYSSDGGQYGTVRFNISSQQFEYCANQMWRPIQTSVQGVGLTGTASAAIAWALAQMHKEERISQLASSNAAVQIAVENLNKAKEQLDIAVILSSQDPL